MGASIDWKRQQRRPFKRGFLPYGTGKLSAAKVKKRRAVTGVSVVSDPLGEESTPAPVESFEELGVIPPWLLETLRDEQAYEPGPLHAQALPIALAGQNLACVTAVAAASSAGSAAACGQAAAYLLPAVVHIDDQVPLTDEEPGPVVLVLAPTEKAAAQIAASASKLLRNSARSPQHSEDGIRVVNVSGGGTRTEKLEQLTSRGAHIVVGTPKRLHDMAAKEQLSLLRVTFIVLDGADRILELGFAEEVKGLAAWTRPERQSLLLAATWPAELQSFATELCRGGGDAVRIRVKRVATPAVAAAPKKRAAAEPEQDAEPELAEAAEPARKVVKKVSSAAAATEAAEPAAEVDMEDFPEGW